MVGVRAVKQEWHPEAMDVAITIQEPPCTKVATFPTKWYWQEDESRLGAHNKQDIYQPGNFVAFSGSVTAEIEAAYISYQSLSADSSVLRLNLVDRIASTGTETKAFAPESGYDYEINFATMMQANLKSGFARKIFRREVAPTWPARTPETPAFAAAPMPSVSEPSLLTMEKDKPSEINDEDSLVLYQGQLVQLSKQRPDGWAFGSIVFDPEADRAPIDVDGFSGSSGWFPLEYTVIPSNEQLKGWQDAMGGRGADALAPPRYWDQVRDPLVTQLFPLPMDAERAKISEFFLQTLTNVKILEVSRIQSTSLWQSYAAKRQTVAQREMAAQGLSEKAALSRFEREWLFHGTTEDIVPKIVQQGFNRSFCGRNATAFGKGVYFARDASYSSGRQYSAPNKNGEQHMFLCRVVVGEYCRGVKDALTPDVRSGHQLYDTTVDNTTHPSIFVTYHDAQAYPEYLVKFTQ